MIFWLDRFDDQMYGNFEYFQNKNASNCLLSTWLQRKFPLDLYDTNVYCVLVKSSVLATEFKGAQNRPLWNQVYPENVYLEYSVCAISSHCIKMKSEQSQKHHNQQ